MRERLILLTAVVALLVVGTVPASAAPGGVPGPPEGHGPSVDKPRPPKADADGESKDNGPPEWAKAYGWRIQDEFGMTYGHLQQCARAAAVDGVEGDAAVESEESGDDDSSKFFLDDCPVGEEMPEFPEEPGAKALWEAFVVATESGMLIVGM
jgi:hypothetical protein